MNIKISEDSLMKMAAQSDVIVRGKIVTDLAKVNIQPNAYLDLTITPIEILKGEDVPSPIPWKHFVRETLDINFDNVFILFLSDHRHDEYSKCFYPVSESTIIGTGFFLVDQDLLKRVKSEIQIQQENVKHFADISTKTIPLEDKVKILIADMLDARKAPTAYKSLENLGEKAVPAIIHNMNDMRDLPVKHIQLENKSPQAWEAFRHYGPQKVIDVLDAILNQITGEYLGEIHNGGTDKQRLKAYHAWINWLSKRK